jgi:inorganic pyrophosphatase
MREHDVVIEVSKWSFVKRRGADVVEFGSPLPCPFNYGYVPGTESADGSPRDALVVGPRLARTARVRARELGIVRFLDAGLQDDKLVCGGTALSRLDRLRVSTFFSVYALAKRLRNVGGGGPTRFLGFEEHAREAGDADSQVAPPTAR